MAEPTDTQEILKHVDQYLQNIGTATSQVVHQYGGDIMATTLEYVQITGLVTVVGGFFALGFALLLSYFAKKTWYMLKYEDPRMFFSPISILISTIFYIIASCQILDIWAWVEIFNPKIGLVHEILSTTTKK